MTTPERRLKIFSGTDMGSKEEGKGGSSVRIYPDGTAKEGQSVPEDTRCYWTGFIKKKDEHIFYGKPVFQGGS